MHTIVWIGLTTIAAELHLLHGGEESVANWYLVTFGIVGTIWAAYNDIKRLAK